MNETNEEDTGVKVLVFGSMNIDRTYLVDHFVNAGETMTADRMELFCGGKGFNQAIALARAGIPVAMAGAVGEDGDFLLDPLKEEGVDVSLVKKAEGASGHAVIQVDRNGGNCIIILAGANGTVTEEDAEQVLKNYGAGDWIVLQNEISSLDYILKTARKKGMHVALNPSPFNEVAAGCDFSCVDYLIVNEVEAAAVGERKQVASFDDILEAVRDRCPNLSILMTLGSRGSVLLEKDGTRTECGIYQTEAVDTTAAGDCFTGYFLAGLLRGESASKALKTAAVASGISVSRKGASPSVPYRREVDLIDETAVPDRYTRDS